jgi:hypothetical protein
LGAAALREPFETDLQKALRFLRDGEERLTRMEKLLSKPHALPAHQENAMRALAAIEESVRLTRAYVERLIAKN